MQPTEFPSIISTQKRPLFSFSVFLLGIVLLVTLLYGVLSYLKQQEILQLQREESILAQETAGIMTGELSRLDQTSQIIKAITVERSTWASPLTELFSLFPPGISFSSLQMDEKGKMTINLVASSPDTIIAFLNDLQKSPTFNNVFLPSLSSGTTLEHGSVIHFPLMLDISGKKG